MIKEKSLLDFSRRLQVTATEKGIPVFGGFELTSRCNLSCKMCYIKDNENKTSFEGELTARQWIELGHEAADCGMLVVYLTGGEPLVRTDFKEIYEAFNRLGLRINLFTNGTLITEEMLRWLSEMPPSTVDVSLYGASGKTYLELCGKEEAYNRTCKGIELLLKYGINTRIKTTIVRSNKNDYDAIKDIAQKLGLEFLSSNLIHGNRKDRIKNIENERLSPEEIFEAATENLNEYNCKLLNIEEIKKSLRNLPAMSCSAGKSSFFINWKGDLVPCALFDTLHTKPLITGFKTAWDELREKTKDIPGVNECSECDSRAFCPVCPGRLYLETGKFDSLSDYVCRLAKEKGKIIQKLYHHYNEA